MTTKQKIPSLFELRTCETLSNRLDALRPESPALWGKMNVAQMLAHCCIPFEQALGLRHDGPNWFMKFLLRNFFKRSMVNEIPYRQNLPTAPSFVIADERMFSDEKARLQSLIARFSEKGPGHFEGRRQISLGPLTASEWNNLMFKHLDHHLRQFGV
jgi:hypothetical protein